jgi:hypothetical protein
LASTLKEALSGTYLGLDADDEETCGHVAFNADVKKGGGVLAIFPPLQNQAPPEHVISALGGTTNLELKENGKVCTLVAPADSTLQSKRERHPLHGRRFPALASMVSSHAPTATFIDVGAGIGDSIALARLAGARMPALAVEPSLTLCKLLWANLRASPALFNQTGLVWGDAGGADGGAVGTAPGSDAGAPKRTPGVRLETLARDLDVALVKTSASGSGTDMVAGGLEFLRSRSPILWLHGQTRCAADEEKWSALLSALDRPWANMLMFDNFGFALAASRTRELAPHAVRLMAYARRQRARTGYQLSLDYLELALFPARFDAVHDLFRQSLPELST